MDFGPLKSTALVFAMVGRIWLFDTYAQYNNKDEKLQQ